MLNIFVGFDSRESLGYHVFCQSLLEHATEPFSVTPLGGSLQPGTTRFCFDRFLVPSLCSSGPALFLDGSDMLVRASLSDLFSLADTRFAVQVVKHAPYEPTPRKFMGSSMEAANEYYPKKNWSSVMLFANCKHPTLSKLTRDYISSASGEHLHRFGWADDSSVGDLPPDWNHLVGEQPANESAKIVHWTLGLPAIKHYQRAEFAKEWFSTCDRALEAPK